MTALATKRYEGRRTPDGCVVTVAYEAVGTGFAPTVVPLDPRFDLRNHSPTGFEWGYGGSGPAQLALALLCDALGDDVRALELYQDFKFRVVALFESGGWSLTEESIRDAARVLEVIP